jgi:tellurite resistance protein TerC
MIDIPLSYWILFNLSILILLFIDLKCIHSTRNTHPSMISSGLTSLGWISLALCFNLWIYHEFGEGPALDFMAGYLLEKSLSIDNLFVFLLIFSHFKTPPEDKYSILFYGVLGAIIMRAILIAGGLTLVHYFDWIFYVFGGFLIFGGVQLVVQKKTEIEPEKTLLYQYFRRWFPNAHRYVLVIALIEVTDFIFALDSVPAIFGITTDPFIVYTSNIFAILGLRSLFFLLEPLIEKFYLLHYAISAILIFIGIKLLAHGWIIISTKITLLIILGILSLLHDRYYFLFIVTRKI